MKDYAYAELVRAGAPPLDQGFAYRIKIDAEGDLVVRVVLVLPKRWWQAGRREVVVGEAWNTSWHWQRHADDPRRHIAQTAREAFEDVAIRQRREFIEGRYTGRRFGA